MDLQVDTSIINPRHSIPEPQLISSDNFFNGWFGIPFTDESRITHIRSPQPSEILSLYRFCHLIPLHPSLLSVPILRQLVLHILPSCLAQQLSTILPSPHQTSSASHSHNKCINYYSICNQCQVRLRRRRPMQRIKKSLLLNHSLHHQAFGKNSFSSFPAQYRSTVVNNSLYIIEGRLIFPNRSQQLLTNTFVL